MKAKLLFSVLLIIFSLLIAKIVVAAKVNAAEQLIKKIEQPNKETEHSIFTKSERQYIRDNPVVKLGLEEWRPIIFSGPNNSINGIAGDYLVEIAKISGLSFEVTKGDWDRLLNALKDGKIDFLPAGYYSKQRAEFALFSDQYFELGLSIAIRKGKNYSSFDQLKDKKLALVRGYATIDLIKQQYPQINIVLTNTVGESLRLLSTGEVDATLGVNIVLRHEIYNNLISNVKLINQDDIDAKAIHFISRKDLPLLQSILNKSLFNIPQAKKIEIIRKWSIDSELKSIVNIAFGIGREPYSVDLKNQLKGIEFDILQRAFEGINIQVNKAQKLVLAELEHALSDDPTLDAAITLGKTNNNYYYSDYLIEFHNVVVTRTLDKLEIDSIKDLQGKKMTAFKGAVDILGQQYYRLFNPEAKPSHYSEAVFQGQQFSDLLSGATDVLVIDRNIFKWYARKANLPSLPAFTFHEVFTQHPRLYVAFRNEKLRDIFNQELNKLKNNGEYQYIIDDYTQGFIVKKIELSAIISSISANLIANYQLIELKTLLNELAQLHYIDGIKLYDIEAQLIHRTLSFTGVFYNQVNSIDMLSNAQTKEGRLEIYFNDQLVEQQLTNSSLIPVISLFKDYQNYNYIRALYRRLNILGRQLSFTSAEQEYLNTHPILSYSAIEWRPLSIIESSGNSGIMFDYLNVVTKLTGIEFEFIEIGLWHDIIAAFKAEKIDFLPSISTSQQSQALGLTTHEYMSFNFAITMAQDVIFSGDLDDLYDKKIAVVKSSSAFNYVSQFKDLLNVITVPDLNSGLELVSSGKVDAVIEHFAVMVYQLKNHFHEVKIVGMLDSSYSHRMVVQADNPILLSILNKVIDSISFEQHQEIKQRWINVDVSTVVDYRLIYQLIGLFIFILIVLSILHRKRAIISREIAQTNQKLNLTVAALKEQKSVFETLFYDTADGLLLTVDQTFIDCNRAALDMLGYRAKTKLLNQSIADISPKFQPDGEVSADKCRRIDQQCITDGTARFEWVHLDVNNKELWVEVVLTRISLNNQNVIHTVWRDINEKKQLEQQILYRNKELETSNNELERVISDLKETQQHLVASEKMASLGGLVAGIAHEINTPVGIGLTAITHFLEITKTLEHKYQTKKMSQQNFEHYLAQTVEAANIINRNLERTADLVRSFKLIAVDQSSDERRTFNVKTYINEILISINHITKKSKMKIIASCDGSLVINSYPGAFSQIISNLIINSSIHAFPSNESGEIIITVRQQNGEVRLVYRDDGVGISEKNLSKIFDPFFTTNREHGGSGLGLNIVYNIVTNRLKGKIECTSQLGCYTQFLIVFKPNQGDQ